MKYEDLSFTIVNDNGEELINDVTSVIPNVNNSEEPYVIFTDYTLDDKDEFIKKYGRLVRQGDNFFIETNLNEAEITYINQAQEDEIIKYVNDAIEENLYE